MLATTPEPVPVSIDARIGRGRCDRTLCRVTGLSPDGAVLHSYAVPRPGTTVWLTLPHAGPVAATIDWSDDFTAECRFHNALDDTIFGALIDACRRN